jgi:CelD/BcsL family acetyltransferase involved in cellulose biosynthesis
VFDFELISNLAQLSEMWDQLSETSGNIFSGWEWSMLWWRHFGRGRRLFLGICRNGTGAVTAIVPLYVWRERPLRVLRLLGHGHGDMLGPVCARGDPETSVTALRTALSNLRFDAFVGDWMPARGEWSSSLGARTLRESGYPILRFGVSSWDEFLEAKGRHFRKAVGQQQRRLEREYDVRFRFANDPGTLERDLDALFALHRAHFQEHAQCFFCGENEQFQRAFAARALERGWLRLCLLEVDGRPVAAEYGFRLGEAYFAYQVGRDPA